VFRDNESQIPNNYPAWFTSIAEWENTLEKCTSNSDVRSALNSSAKAAVVTMLFTSAAAAIHLYGPNWYALTASGRTQMAPSNSIPQYSHDVAFAYGILIPAVVATSVFVSQYSKQSYSFTRSLIIISASLAITDLVTQPVKGGRNHVALFTAVLFVGAILLRFGSDNSRDVQKDGPIV
jgi:hypothetical protein